MRRYRVYRGFIVTANSDGSIPLNSRIVAVVDAADSREQAADDLAQQANAAHDLFNALQQLHDNIAEYARINNLGGFNNQDMQQARAALDKARGI